MIKNINTDIYDIRLNHVLQDMTDIIIKTHMTEI